MNCDLCSSYNRVYRYLFVVFFLLNLSLFIANVYYICHWYPRIQNELELDYLGIIIGVLSFLVTVVAIIWGYNIFHFDKRINDIIDSKQDELRREMNNIISDTKAQLYYGASLIGKDSKNIHSEFHNLFLAINEMLNNNIASEDEYNAIENRIYEIIHECMKMKKNYDISFEQPQFEFYISTAKRMKGKFSNVILKYLLQELNKI